MCCKPAQLFTWNRAGSACSSHVTRKCSLEPRVDRIRVWTVNINFAHHIELGLVLALAEFSNLVLWLAFLSAELVAGEGEDAKSAIFQSAVHLNQRLIA